MITSSKKDRNKRDRGLFLAYKVLHSARRSMIIAPRMKFPLLIRYQYVD